MTVRLRSTFRIGSRLQLADPLEVIVPGEAGPVRIAIEESTVNDERLLVVESTIADPAEEAAIRGGGSAARAIGDRYGSMHSGLASRTRRFLRWRLKLDDDAASIAAPPRLTWEADGRSGTVPKTISASIHARATFTQARYAVPPADLADRIAAGRIEPVAHELVREAFHVAATSRRSALVLGIAALEAGVKGYVSDLAPDTRWLVENLPAPPVVEMLIKYVGSLPPRLPVGGQVVIAKAVAKRLAAGVTARNDLVHRGVIRATSELVHPRSGLIQLDKLTGLLVDIRDVLYMLDFHSGEEWAASHVSGDSRAALAVDRPT